MASRISPSSIRPTVRSPFSWGSRMRRFRPKSTSQWPPHPCTSSQATSTATVGWTWPLSTMARTPCPFFSETATGRFMPRRNMAPARRRYGRAPETSTGMASSTWQWPAQRTTRSRSCWATVTEPSGRAPTFLSALNPLRWAPPISTATASLTWRSRTQTAPAPPAGRVQFRFCWARATAPFKITWTTPRAPVPKR